MHLLQNLLLNEEKANGICSCCSSNRFVIKAAIKDAKDRGTVALIEATANQVDQFGGYTGMTPVSFIKYVEDIAEEYSFPKERLILGGDHLGPLTFSAQPEKEAMEMALELVRCYVLAGFTKIHLDTSMKLLSDDKDLPLSDEIIANRAAQLCCACETAFQERQKLNPTAEPPIYVIGSEVPIPGGAQEEENSVPVTKYEAAVKTIDSFLKSFNEAGLKKTTNRIIAIVVQPGVEFTDKEVFQYNSIAAKELCSVLADREGMVFEAHSTDYQTRESLQSLVKDGFKILKVGPALTFSVRESLFALSYIEEELSTIYHFSPSNFRQALYNAMYKDDFYWKNHYTGTVEEIRFKMAYSYSDRARYYMDTDEVRLAQTTLINNLKTYEIPLSLLRQFMPVQYEKIRAGLLLNEPEDLIVDAVINCLDNYYYATENN